MVFLLLLFEVVDVYYSSLQPLSFMEIQEFFNLRT